MALSSRWIAKATAHNKGALTKTAEHKGMTKKGGGISIPALQQLKKSKNKTTKKRANLALLLRGFNHKKGFKIKNKGC